MGKYIVIIFAAWAIAYSSYAQDALWEKEVEYISELQSNFSNGKVGWVNVLFLGTSLSTECFGGWKGGSLSAGTISLYRTAKDGIANDFQVFSNINDRSIGVGVFTLGYTHTFERVTLFGGVRNINLDHFITPYALTYTHSSAGIVPPLIFNFSVADFTTSAMCVHVEWQASKRLYVKSSLYNGIAHDQRNNILASFTIDPRNDGLLNINELSLLGRGEMAGCYSLSWAIGNEFERRIGKPETYRAVWNRMRYAIWGVVEHPFYRTADRELGVLVQAATAPFSGSSSRSFFALGGYFQGLILKSRGDKLGFYGTVGSYKDGLAEKSLEVTWKFPLGKYVVLQPALHLIDTDSKITQAALVRMYVTIR